jgi:hypothetical protein
VVNAGQQVGGSIGTSLLNTVAASAAAGYLAGHLSPRLMAGGRPAPALVELAQVHSYTIAFWWAAGMFAAGSVLAALAFHRGSPAAPAPAAGPAALRKKVRCHARRRRAPATHHHRFRSAGGTGLPALGRRLSSAATAAPCRSSARIRVLEAPIVLVGRMDGARARSGPG